MTQTETMTKWKQVEKKKQIPPPRGFDFFQQKFEKRQNKASNMPPYLNVF